MNAVTGKPADAGAGLRLDVGGSVVSAARSEDGVLVVRVYPVDDTPVAVFVDEALVAGSEMSWRPVGRHRLRQKAGKNREPRDNGGAGLQRQSPGATRGFLQEPLRQPP